MGEVNFYLKKAEPTTGKCLIVLYKRYSGKRLVFSTGQTIQKKDWNANKQRVKNNSATTDDGSQYLNDFLNGLVKECETQYKKALVHGSPSPEMIKELLKKYVNKNDDEPKVKSDFFKLIDRFIAGDIKNKGRDKSANTLQNYNTVKGHLKAFEEKERTKITFETITLDFFYSYVSFLKKLKDKNGKPLHLKQNTIAKDITVIKTFMGEAVDLGFTNNMQFRHKKFTIEEEETDAVYLNEKEIVDLYRHDFSDNRRLEQARDLFIFGSYVGLRYSDYSTVKQENIVTIDKDLFIKIIPRKTKDLVYIPCNPTVLEIFKKYDDSPNKLPKTISNQRFNDYVKEACKLAGFTEKGRLSTDLNLELWQCVSSHTARRSFATNLYLEGFPTIDLMKITGHKTEKAFLKYIRVNKLDAAKRLSAHMKKSWSEKMLRVAG